MIDQLSVLIGTIHILPKELSGHIIITRTENQTAIAQVRLLREFSEVEEDFKQWTGKPIIITINTVMAYRGVVDRPDVDQIGRFITLHCTDRRREIINEQDVSAIGFHSDAIFGDVDTVYQELEQRLQTTPKVVDITPLGDYAITDLLPKVTGDVFLFNDDIRLKTVPKIELTSRARITNHITVQFEYRYTRLRHREQNFKIEDYSFCEILDQGITGHFSQKTSFLAYANSMTWMLNESSIIWEPMLDTGWTSPPCTVKLIYLHDDRYATSMSYKSALKFAQTITEKYNIIVTANDSIALYGTVPDFKNYGLEIEYDSSVWENNTTYTAPSGGIYTANDYYIDQDGDNAEFNNAVETAVNIASTSILKSHRNTSVEFITLLRLDIDLTKTISIDATTIRAVGKAIMVEHVIDVGNKFAQTTTQIALSTGEGGGISSYVPPVRPTVPILRDPYPNPLVMLIADNEIISPEIDDISRNEHIEIIDTAYNISIPNDQFSITYNYNYGN